MKRPYRKKARFLIQKGVFKENTKNTNNLESVVRLVHMGASEYELNALPDSFNRMMDLFIQNKLKPYDVIIHNKRFCILIEEEAVERKQYGFHIFCPITEIKAVFRSLASREGKYRVKRSCNFYAYFEGKIVTRLKKGCIKKTIKIPNWSYCDFWWDIEEDFMIFPVEKYSIIEQVFKGNTKETKKDKKTFLSKLFSRLFS